MFDRLTRKMLEIVGPPSPAAAPSPRDRIEWRTIDAVLADGLYRVGADALATIGQAKLAAGERVAVLLRDGRAVGILAHTAKRAQGGTRPSVVAGLVESLNLSQTTAEADAGAGLRGLYFRNASQFTRVLDFPEADDAFEPHRFGWGEADNTLWVERFMVTTHARTGAPGALRPYYEIYRLNRDEGIGLDDPAEVELVATRHVPPVNVGTVAAGPAGVPVVFPDDFVNLIEDDCMVASLDGVCLTADLRIVLGASLRRGELGIPASTGQGASAAEAFAVVVSDAGAALAWQGGALDGAGVPPSGPGNRTDVHVAAYDVQVMQWGAVPADQRVVYFRSRITEVLTYSGGVPTLVATGDVFDLRVVTTAGAVLWRHDASGYSHTAVGGIVTAASGVVDLARYLWHPGVLLYAVKTYTDPTAMPAPRIGGVELRVVDVDAGTARTAGAFAHDNDGAPLQGLDFDSPEGSRWKVTQPLAGVDAYVMDELRYARNSRGDGPPPPGISADEAGHVVDLDTFDPLVAVDGDNDADALAEWPDDVVPVDALVEFYSGGGRAPAYHGIGFG